MPGVPVGVIYYKAFSTHKQYLPLRPEFLKVFQSREQLAKYSVDDVALAPKLALVGGDTILNNQRVMALLESRDEAVKAQATTNNAYLKEMQIVNNLRPDISDICDHAMITMLERLDVEAEEHRTKLNMSRFTKLNFDAKAASDARKQIKIVSDKQRGYLMLLNDDPFPGDLAHSKPRMIDIRVVIPEVLKEKVCVEHNVVEGEEPDEGDVANEELAARNDETRVGQLPSTRKKTASRKEGMITAAKAISSAAKALYDSYQQGKIILATPPDKFDFSGLYITQQELNWLQARLTPVQVLQVIAQDFAQREQEEFQLVHFPDRSLFHTVDSEQRRAQVERELIEANRIGTSVFMRPHSTIAEGTELVGRDNFTTAVTKISAKVTIKSQEQTLNEIMQYFGVRSSWCW